MKNNLYKIKPKLSQLFVGLAVMGLIGCGGSNDNDGKNRSSSSVSSLPSELPSSSSVSSSVAVSSSSSVSSSVAVSSSSSVSSSSVVSSSSAVSSSADSSSSSSAAAIGAWGEPVWRDEFDGTSIDTTKWSFEKNCWGGGNQELQCYTDSTDNAFVQNGILNIRAIDGGSNTAFSGPGTYDDDPNYPGVTQQRRYSSARLRSKGKGEWKYGRMEIRAKVPYGKGMWAAGWMLPTDQFYGGWPNSGEIDILETPNAGTTPPAGITTTAQGNRAHGTLHYGGSGDQWRNSGTFYIPPRNLWEHFHTYAIEWEEDEIRFYVDDTHYATQIASRWHTRSPLGEGRLGAPFDQRFHMILNLAVGGQWPGNPATVAVPIAGYDTTIFPQSFEVDFVRVYECRVNGQLSTSGKGCASNVNPNVTPLTGYPKPQPAEVLNASFDVFTDAVAARWDLGVRAYNSGAYQIQPTIVDADAGEESRGKVINIRYGNTNGLAYIAATNGKDINAFTGDSYLEFDVKVKNYGAANGLVIKVECGENCGSGDVLTNGKVGDGSWQTVRIPVSRFITNVGSTLNVDRMTAPFVILPPWNTQDGVELQLDNIRWVLENPTTAAPSFPMTFTGSSYTFGPFGGSEASFAADPTNANNQVLRIIKPAGAQTWAGVTVSTRAGGRVDTTAFATKNLTMRVNAPAGTVFLAKVEDASAAANACERQVTTSVTGWQTLQFNFAGFCSGAYTYNRFSVFPAFNSAGTGATYYVDDVTVVDPAP